MRIVITSDSDASFKHKIECHTEHHGPFIFNGHNLEEVKSKVVEYFSGLQAQFKLANQKMGL